MRTRLSLIAIPIAFVAGCGGSSSGTGSTSGGAASAHGGVLNGGAPALGGAPASGGATSSGGSSSGIAGSASGGLGTAGAAHGGGSGAANALGGAANSSGAGGRRSGGGAGGSFSGGMSGGPAGGNDASAGNPSVAGNGGGGDGTTSGCTRELLKSAIDAYFKALAAHDPSTLPLADNVKFTENGAVLKLGEAGLWQTAGALAYAHSALDTETCNSATQAVVPDGNDPIPVALRLKLENQKITEIETIAVRPGDYEASGQTFDSDTDALIASGNSVKWEQPVPADQRNSREEITSWMNKYFRLFPRGVCNTTSDCKRIENGGGSFSCSAGASCDAGQPSTGQAALEPRLILADVETGLGVGFTMFQGNTDMHLFKMYGGQVHGVSAVLGAAGSSGWD